MRTIHRDIAGPLIVSRDGKIFLAKKDPKDQGVYENAWVVPGGGIEDGETPVQAVIRETREETGIELTEAMLTLVRDDGKGESEKTLRDTGERVRVVMRFYDFRADVPIDAAHIEVTLCHEFSEYRWLVPEELSSMSLGSATRELLVVAGVL